MDATQARTDALAFLKRNRTGVLATAGRGIGPHASVLHYYADDDFNIYFFTPPSSRKFAALSQHPQVAFVVIREDAPQTIQIEGMAKDVTLEREFDNMRPKIIEALQANPFFAAPMTKLDPETPALVRIRPTWIRWADYAFAPHGSDKVFTEIAVSA